MGRKKTVYIILAAMLLLESGCRLNYKEAGISDTMDEAVPNSVLTDFSQTVVRNRKVAYTVEADSATSFDSSSSTCFTNISFREFDPEGNIGTEGAAADATYFSDTDNIIFDGDLVINSREQDFTLRSNYLEWNDRNRILKSRDDTPVTVEQGEGTVIKGRGFISDAARKTFTVLSSPEGKFTKEETDNEESNQPDSPDISSDLSAPGR